MFTGRVLLDVSKEMKTRLLAQEVTPPLSARNIGIVFDSA